ncbi:hypothetical protein DID80_05260 [Candidatus Marinamargulisbacteria bacterium SCGC AAA071-K20]|nr:hypothetical protein DID80_05260 [Candidatus Marinamargulisbacteria bacterium SCGC AAA071-K20]
MIFILVFLSRFYLVTFSLFLFASSSICHEKLLRVVSLSPVSTEIVATLNGSILVGVSKYCNYPNSINALPKVGDLTINYEKVLALNPDKIVGVGVSKIAQDKFKSLGLSTLFLESPESLKDILNTIDRIGTYVGETESAKNLISSMNVALLNFKNTKPKVKRKVIVVLQYNPIIVAGSNGFISEILELSGGVYPLKSSKIQYPRVPLERVLEADPEFIICGYPNLKHNLYSDRVILMTQAGRDRHIINSINPDLFLRPGPRIINGIEELRKVIQ